MALCVSESLLYLITFRNKKSEVCWLVADCGVPTYFPAMEATMGPPESRLHASWDLGLLPTLVGCSFQLLFHTPRRSSLDHQEQSTHLATLGCPGTHHCLHHLETRDLSGGDTVEDTAFNLPCHCTQGSWPYIQS